MGPYRVEISPTARAQLKRYTDYILLTLMNGKAADAVLSDALETIDELEKTAGSHAFCEDPDLKALGYHRILMRRHHYVMIYDIKGNTVRIKAVYHLLQDYENLFSAQIR